MSADIQDPNSPNDKTLQFTDSFIEENLDQEGKLLLQLSDQINQTPNRKVSLAFFCKLLFGNGPALGGILNLAFFGIPAFFIFIDFFISNDQASDSDFTMFFGLLLMAFMGLVLFRPYYKALKLFKTGYFTVGYLMPQGFIYNDSDGKLQSRKLPRLYKFSQPFIEIQYLDYEPYLIIVGKKPNDILIFDAVSYPQTNNIVGFNYGFDYQKLIFKFKISFNLQSKTFIEKPRYLWLLFVPALIIFWALLCLSLILFPAH